MANITSCQWFSVMTNQGSSYTMSEESWGRHTPMYGVLLNL